jgi:hypothetical protein
MHLKTESASACAKKDYRKCQRAIPAQGGILEEEIAVFICVDQLKTDEVVLGPVLPPGPNNQICGP